MVQDTIRSIGWVDGVSLALLALFFLRGIWKGFVWQIAGLVTLVGGLLAAQALAPRFAPTLGGWFPRLRESNIDIIAAYFAIFVAVMVVVIIAAKLLRGLLDRLQLSAFDRLLGGVFGSLKAAVLVIIAVSVLSLFDWPNLNQKVAKAYTGRVADFAIQKGGPLFPDEVQQRVRQTMEDLEQTIRRGKKKTKPGAPASAR